MHQHRLELTRRLVTQLPESHATTVDQAMKTWWVNIRASGGMRLTHAGYEIMKDVLQLEHWDWDLADEPRQIFNKKMILDLDRRLEWPFFIEVNIKKKRRHIVFFSSREAMMARLFNDLRAWLDSLG